LRINDAAASGKGREAFATLAEPVLFLGLLSCGLMGKPLDRDGTTKREFFQLVVEKETTKCWN
jgi:hypothetical protein